MLTMVLRAHRTVRPSLHVALGLAIAACGTGTGTPPPSPPPAAPSTTAGQPASTPSPRGYTPRSPVPVATPTAEDAVLDGEPWIVYQSIPDAGGPAKLHLVRPDGTGEHQLLPPALRNLDQGHPSWSPDGTRIAFDVESPGDPAPFNLWITGVDGSDAHRLAGCEAKPCLQLAYPSWSPDGTRIAYARYDIRANGNWGKSAIELLDVATGKRTIVAESADGATAYYVPRWSPDGRSIVLVVETYPDESEAVTSSSRLAVLEVGSRPAEPVRITPDTYAAAEPDWGMAGRIAFTRYDAPDAIVSTGSIATIAPDGTDLRDVTPRGGGDGIEPTWLSPTRLMYVGHTDATPMDRHGRRRWNQGGIRRPGCSRCPGTGSCGRTHTSGPWPRRPFRNDPARSRP